MRSFAVALLSLLATSAEALRVGVSVQPLLRVGTARALTPCMQEAPATGEIAAGSTVLISGLSSTPELNGLVGKVEEFDAESGRYAVRAADKLVLLKPEKLEVKLVWNTALDADGETYYWNAAGSSQYEKPADFDPALAKKEGVYQAKDDALYDDEVQDGGIRYSDGTKKPELSNSMRDKMIAESRGLGADPNQKNPFLIVFVGVGLFVLAGAASFTG
jgi:hypothetical protein